MKMQLEEQYAAKWYLFGKLYKIVMKKFEIAFIRSQIELDELKNGLKEHFLERPTSEVIQYYL